MKKIREILEERATVGPIVETTAPGLGKVKVRRVDAAEGMDFGDGCEAIAATLQDEQGAPLFQTADDVRKADWGVVQALMVAYHNVNRLEALVEEAAKK